MITEKELTEAIERIGGTPDGELLYLSLQRFLCGVPHSVDPGALQQMNGKRMFAQQLMTLLSKGLSETHAGSRSDRICIFANPEPRRVEHGGPRRRGYVGTDDFKSEFPDHPGGAS